MDEAEASQFRLNALRDAGRLVAARDARWRRAGLAAGGAAALMLAYATLSPVAMPVTAVSGLDKVAHFIGFAVLIFPVILTNPRRWLWAVPLAIGFGGAIELVQPLVGRSAEWLDWGADISGVLAGAALAELLHDRIHARLVGTEAQADEADDVAFREAQRAELMEDLRAVLREELAVIRRPGEAPTAVENPADAGRTDLRH